MAQPARIRGAEHGLAVGFFQPKAREPADVVPQLREILLAVALREVHREHASGRAAAKGGVLGVVVEQQEIARRGIEGERRNIAAVDAVVLLTLAHGALEQIGKPFADPVAAGNHPKAAVVAIEWLEVEGELDVGILRVPAIGVPVGVADVVVAIAAGVIEVVAQQGVGDAENSVVVEERGEALVLIDERNERRARGAVVLSTAVAAAVRGPDPFERVDDRVDIAGEQPGKLQKSECLEVGNLPIAKLHHPSFIPQSGTSAWFGRAAPSGPMIHRSIGVSFEAILYS